MVCQMIQRTFVDVQVSSALRISGESIEGSFSRSKKKITKIKGIESI